VITVLEWNLDKYMDEEDLTFQEVVEKTKVHKNIISRIKNNRQRRLDLDVLERIIKGLDCQPNDLFRYTFKND
jgi:DNA-binding Xre family transcriptional regulator